MKHLVFTEVGRVLSAKNEARLRAALAELDSVLKLALPDGDAEQAVHDATKVLQAESGILFDECMTDCAYCPGMNAEADDDEGSDDDDDSIETLSTDSAQAPLSPDDEVNEAYDRLVDAGYTEEQADEVIEAIFGDLEEHNAVPHGPAHGGRKGSGVVAAGDGEGLAGRMKQVGTATAKAAGLAPAAGHPLNNHQPGIGSPAPRLDNNAKAAGGVADKMNLGIDSKGFVAGAANQPISAATATKLGSELRAAGYATSRGDGRGRSWTNYDKGNHRVQVTKHGDGTRTVSAFGKDKGPKSEEPRGMMGKASPAAKRAAAVARRNPNRAVYGDEVRAKPKRRAAPDPMRKVAKAAGLPYYKRGGIGAVQDSDREGLEGELFVEAAVRPDGTVPIKIISPGWGSSGFYGEEVLKRDGPKVFKAGTQMYWDHPTKREEDERPERSLRDLAAVTETAAHWMDNGPNNSGPGLFANAKVFGPYREVIDELAAHIGTSIRAVGRASVGEREGRKGKIVEALVGAKSIDFVTKAGRGGQVLSLFESARGLNEQADNMEDEDDVNLLEAQRQIEAQEAENAKLREALASRDAKDLIVAVLGTTDLPAAARTKLAESALLRAPIGDDGTLDAPAFTTIITNMAEAEKKYVDSLTGPVQVTGMGRTAQVTESENLTSELEKMFGNLGLSESQAKTAAAGRSH